MLMNHFALLNMRRRKMSKNTLFNHYITNIEERNNKLEAVSFSDSMEIKFEVSTCASEF